MKRMILVVFPFLLAGCNAQIADYVRKDKAPEAVVTPNTAESKMKISPGAVASAGANTGGRFTITPTNVQMTGSQVGAKLSISQSRME